MILSGDHSILLFLSLSFNIRWFKNTLRLDSSTSLSLLPLFNIAKMHTRVVNTDNGKFIVTISCTYPLLSCHRASLSNTRSSTEALIEHLLPDFGHLYCLHETNLGSHNESRPQLWLYVSGLQWESWGLHHSETVSNERERMNDIS